MEKRIQRAFCNFNTCGKEDDFNELFELTSAKWKQKVIRYLKSKGCYNDETLDDTLCRAEIGVWKAAKNTMGPGNYDSTEFCAYSYGIFMNSVKGVVKEYYSKHNQVNVNTVSVEQSNEKGINLLQGREVENQFSKRINGVTRLVGPEQHKDIPDKKRSFVFQRLLYEYFVTLMNAKVVPQKSLALVYARIIPHLLKEIPDEKASSAKTAISRMKGKTMLELKVEAEKILQKYVSMDMSFKEPFLKQLDMPIGVGGDVILIKDMYYTDMYDEDKIEHWSDNLHAIIIRETYKRLQEEEEFIGLADRYLKSRNKYCTLIGKKYTKVAKNSKKNCKDR